MRLEPVTFAIPPRPIVTLATTSGLRFPVRRIFCIGRNYAAHAIESGADPSRDPPFFFMKPVDALVSSGSEVPYPPHTERLEPEVELVVALGEGGRDISRGEALDRCVFGYAVGLDMTRRDVQRSASHEGLPWDLAKGFDQSAPCAPIARRTPGDAILQGRMTLHVNGELRQSTLLSEMIWSVSEAIQALSSQVELRPGDLLFTGTPAGTQPVVRGDVLDAAIDGLPPLSVTIA